MLLHPDALETDVLCYLIAQPFSTAAMGSVKPACKTLAKIKPPEASHVALELLLDNCVFICVSWPQQWVGGDGEGHSPPMCKALTKTQAS